MAIAFIAFGSNKGNRKKYINEAVKLISEIDGVRILKVSSIIESKPVGFLFQRDFLNGVLKIQAEITPFVLLENLQKIEQKLKRKRLIKNGPRTIDLDILLYGNLVVKSKKLVLPHPRMLERGFVIKPLLELEPDVFKKYNCLNAKSVEKNSKLRYISSL